MEFFVRLDVGTYGKAGWPVPAGSLPGAELTRLLVDGAPQDLANDWVFEGGYLRKRTAFTPTADADLLITLKGRVYSIWAPAIATVLSAVITGIAMILAKTPCHPCADTAPGTSANIKSQASAPPPPETKASAAGPQQSDRCPNPPPVDAKPPTDPYTVEVAQATNPSVQFYVVNDIAREAAYKLGDRWKKWLMTAPDEKAGRIIDGAERFVYVGRWYGLSRAAAEGICCYLNSHGWEGEAGSVERHCIPTRSPTSAKPTSATPQPTDTPTSTKH